MARVAIIAANDALIVSLTQQFNKSSLVEACRSVRRFDGGYEDMFAEYDTDTVVYYPQWRQPYEMAPNLAEAAAVLVACAQHDLVQVVIVSSAAVYSASPTHLGIVTEAQTRPRMGRDPIADQWLQLEKLATETINLGSKTTLTILRPAVVLLPSSTDYFSQMFQSRWAFTLPLYDPPLQFLSPEDLATAVCLAVERRAAGVFNVAPAEVVPLRRALQLAGIKRVPVHDTLQYLPRRLLAARGQLHGNQHLPYIRYAWTISNTKIRDVLGFIPEHTSADAVRAFVKDRPSTSATTTPPPAPFDDFGMDPAYIDMWRNRLFRFMHDHYWRVEIKGIAHVPTDGRAVLVGVHRGFMPYDGVVALHQIAHYKGRYVRFLIHPSLTKTPFPFNFGKLGGVNACRENADHILQRDGLLGFFPEGIQGAFNYYRDVYKLGRFGRNEFVRAALRNRAPIIPFVTVGSAEIFPIIAKFNWKWWKRISLWPCFPIAPPFPLLPVPLPSKWHTQYLEPLHVETDYPPEAADDPATVRAISNEVRQRMQTAIDDMRSWRKSIFVGSIFEGET